MLGRDSADVQAYARLLPILMPRRSTDTATTEEDNASVSGTEITDAQPMARGPDQVRGSVGDANRAVLVGLASPRTPELASLPHGSYTCEHMRNGIFVSVPSIMTERDRLSYGSLPNAVDEALNIILEWLGSEPIWLSSRSARSVPYGVPSAPS